VPPKVVDGPVALVGDNEVEGFDGKAGVVADWDWLVLQERGSEIVGYPHVGAVKGQPLWTLSGAESLKCAIARLQFVDGITAVIRDPDVGSIERDEAWKSARAIRSQNRAVAGPKCDRTVVRIGDPHTGSIKSKAECVVPHGIGSDWVILKAVPSKKVAPPNDLYGLTPVPRVRIPPSPPVTTIPTT
jgi:hypothetical protein